MASVNQIITKEINFKVKNAKALSCKIAAVKKGKTVFRYSYGKSYKYYDLASMTKSIFTALYFLDKKLNNTLVAKVVPWLYDSTFTFGQILSHSSGLKAHKKHFNKMINSTNWDFKLKHLLREDAKDLVRKKPVYSDLGFLILYYAIQELEETKDIESVFESLKQKYKIPEGMHFCSGNTPKFKKNLYAPSEKCITRKKIIQGEVLDRNTWAMEGVSTHAGLFGTLSDMLEFYKTLKKVYQPNQFKTISDGWSYGFMKPSGKSTAGQYFSGESIGHLGFTGVSFWYDPKVDFYVTILSNRSYPDRNDVSFNAIRPFIHNLLYKEFVNEHPKPR